MPPRKTTVYCRYTHKHFRCTGTAVDPAGEMLLCPVHVQLARELLARLDHGKATA